MWIARDNDNEVVLFKEKPIWNSEFGVWISEEWEVSITAFPELYINLNLTTKKPMEVKIDINPIR